MNLDKKKIIKDIKKNQEKLGLIFFTYSPFNMQQGIALELLLTVYDLPRKSRHVHVIN